MEMKLRLVEAKAKAQGKQAKRDGCSQMQLQMLQKLHPPPPQAKPFEGSYAHPPPHVTWQDPGGVSLSLAVQQALGEQNVLLVSQRVTSPSLYYLQGHMIIPCLGLESEAGPWQNGKATCMGGVLLAQIWIHPNIFPEYRCTY